MQVKFNRNDPDIILGYMVNTTIPGIDSLTFVEHVGVWEPLFIVDNILLDDESRAKWLKQHCEQVVWARITGDMTIDGYVEGFYELDTAEKTHTPLWRHIVKTIVIEILSDYQITELNESK